MLAEALALMSDDELAAVLREIGRALNETVAMPRAAEAIEEAARRLEDQK